MKKIKLIISFLIIGICLLFSVSSCSKKQDPVPTPKVVEKTGKNVYLAGPMFNASEKNCNLKITNVLESYGYSVFLPQRDGIEAALLEGKTEEELINMIFPLDVQNVLNADIIFMNIDELEPHTH